MVGDKPEGGQWNFDHDNRKKWNGTPATPKHFPIKNSVEDIYQEIIASGCPHFGNLNTENFLWPINRFQSLQVLKHFCEEGLPFFGSFQDAMHVEEPWLFHSRLSFALNTKMLHPSEVIEAAVSAYRQKPERISLSQIEGFVRQIIGWREYMRGIYWWKMPDYANLNYFNHQRPLPAWFWTGKTKMNCMSKSIQQSLDYAYAHHIQRLMVTGNFALLAGIHPDAVDQWYLGIYIDAIEWVEITNTRGMSQFADGGIVGTKPYVSSANYIQKMSNYCGTCYYDASKKTGDKACPFNSLYWRFYEVNRSLLEKNPRIGMMYVTLNKMSPEQRSEYLVQAEKYLSGIETL
jgi:deoxyribodipyrimidine photolyase-related protein